MSLSYLADESRQCGTKRRYSTSGAAKKSAKQTMAMHGGRAITAYKCPWCSVPEKSWWHIGHVSEWRKRLVSAMA